MPCMPQDGVSNEGSRMGADVEMGTGNGSTMLPDLFEHDEEQEKMQSIKDQLAALQVLPPLWPSGPPRDMVPSVPYIVWLTPSVAKRK